MRDERQNCMFERIRNLDAAFPKTGDEIDFEADEFRRIRILRHIETLWSAAMMEDEFFRREADCGSVLPVCHHSRHRFDGIFEQGKTARARPAIDAQTPCLIDQRQAGLGFDDLAGSRDETTQDIVFAIGGNS